jgi:hypothetical protein
VRSTTTALATLQRPPRSARTRGNADKAAAELRRLARLSEERPSKRRGTRWEDSGTAPCSPSASAAVACAASAALPNQCPNLGEAGA